MSEIINILIVGHDPIITMSAGRVLKAEGYNTEIVHSAEEARHRLESNKYDLVLTDLATLQTGGIALIQWTTQCRPAIGIVVVTEDLLKITIGEALRQGTKTHATRPFIPEALKKAVLCATEWTGGHLLKNERGEEFPLSRLAELDRAIHQYRGLTNSALPVLLRAQEIFGYLPPGIQGRIAKGLNVYPSEISSIASFYSFFRTQRGGDHIIRVCRGYSCYLKGSEEIFRGIREALKIGIGGTTRNREFTLEDVRCAGVCNNAPVMVIDREVYGGVTRKKAERLVGGYLRKEDRQLRKNASVQPSYTRP